MAVIRNRVENMNTTGEYFCVISILSGVPLLIPEQFFQQRLKKLDDDDDMRVGGWWGRQMV